MWRDLSVTTLPTPINAYEQYKPLNGSGIITGGGGVGGGGGKWGNQPGNRSSYSLPHPAHVQSNQRWQHYAEQHQLQQQQQHHLQQQQRPLSHSPSYQHIPSSVVNSSGGAGNHHHHQVRSRPVSMYDMPYGTQQPHSFSSFMPPPPPPSASKMMMQNAKHHHQQQQQQHHHSNGNLADSKGGGGGGGSAAHLRQKPGELVR